MEAKSIPEVAFEWLCECGAFDQLKKQCESYTADFAERTVYRFVLGMDVMHLLDFNATLGNLVLTEPLNAINVFQEVCFVIIHTLSWIPALLLPSQVLTVVRFSSVSPRQECAASKNLARYGSSNLVKVVGIVTERTAVTQYTQSARFYCPQSECFGSAKYCYIRVHLAGKTENVTVRSDFVCKYCGSSLIEDVTCRTLADKCIVQVISPSTVHKNLWINTDEGKFYQAIPIYVRDELIKEVQIGCYFSFVVLPSCEIHDSSVHFLCTPVFEANNIEKISPSPFLSLMPSSLPERIEMLYKDRQESPWSFVASLAYCFGGCVTPPGTFFQLKMFMLMCLLLLHSSGSSEDAKQVHSRNLHLLVIANDLLRVQRLLLHGASFARRMLVYSPISELFPSFSRDPFGSDTCMVTAGCIPLATDGICVIPNMAVLKKDQKEKLQNAFENGAVTVKVPEKYWACQVYQLSIPLSSSLWACSEPTQKTGPHQAVLDPMLHPGHMMRDCPTLPRAFVDQFSLVLNLSGSAENFDNSDESVSEEILRKAMEDSEDVASSYISDEEMGQFLQHAGRHHTVLTVPAQDLIQGYYLANRRTRNSHSTGGMDFAASALQTLTSLAIAHAKLSLRSEVRIGRLGEGLYAECFIRFAIDQEKVRREKRSSRLEETFGSL